jgi:phage I-like protein
VFSEVDGRVDDVEEYEVGNVTCEEMEDHKKQVYHFASQNQLVVDYYH